VAAAIEVLSGTGSGADWRVCCRSWDRHHRLGGVRRSGNFATDLQSGSQLGYTCSGVVTAT